MLAVWKFSQFDNFGSADGNPSFRARFINSDGTLAPRYVNKYGSMDEVTIVANQNPFGQPDFIVRTTLPGSNNEPGNDGNLSGWGDPGKASGGLNGGERIPVDKDKDYMCFHYFRVFKELRRERCVCLSWPYSRSSN